MSQTFGCVMCPLSPLFILERGSKTHKKAAAICTDCLAKLKAKPNVDAFPGFSEIFEGRRKGTP